MSVALLFAIFFGLCAVAFGVMLYFAAKEIQELHTKLALPYTTFDAAAVMRVSPTTVRRMAKRGLIRSRKVGKQYRFDSHYIRNLNLGNLPRMKQPFADGAIKIDTDKEREDQRVAEHSQLSDQQIAGLNRGTGE